MDIAVLETKKPPHARNLDEAETKDLGGYDGGLSKTAKSRFPSAVGANLRREVPRAAKFFVAALSSNKSRHGRFQRYRATGSSFVITGQRFMSSEWLRPLRDFSFWQPEQSTVR